MKFEKAWKNKLHTIIHGIDTPLGKAFDIALIFSIIISSVAIILDSVVSINETYGDFLYGLQLLFLLFFTIEYVLRILIAPQKRNYILSFYGLVDFFAIAPIVIGLFIPVGGFFPIIRSLRLLRLFSVFKMGRYIDESGALLKALRASRPKITVFLVTILFIIIIVGTLMFTIEGPENGFVNIPESMYWTVVTVSTVGYGDISPQTQLGKILASGLMLMGYGIIAVPTGIITSEISNARKAKIDDIPIPVIKTTTTKELFCSRCKANVLSTTANYCHVCGKKLE